MLLDSSTEVFLDNHSNSQLHFAYQKNHKGIVYMFQLLSHSIFLILTIVVAVSQNRLIDSIRFLALSSIIIGLHSCSIVIITHFYDSHYRCPRGLHATEFLSILHTPCACVMLNVIKTMNLLNTAGFFLALGYLVILRAYANSSLLVTAYTLLLSFLMKSTFVFMASYNVIWYCTQIIILCIFLYITCKYLEDSFILAIFLGFLAFQHIFFNFSTKWFARRPMQLIYDSQKLQLLCQNFSIKTFANLLPHQMLDCIVQDQEVKLQVHPNMYLLVIRIDIQTFRAKLTKQLSNRPGMRTEFHRQWGLKLAIPDYYINHIIASTIDQFISSIDTILLDDFPQLTKVYSNIETIKVVAGESFYQHNARQTAGLSMDSKQDVDSSLVQSKDYMKLLSTFALLINKCAEVFHLRVDSVITFGDIAIGLMGSTHMSGYEIFGTPVALADKLHEKINAYNQETTGIYASIYEPKQDSNDYSWSESSTTTTTTISNNLDDVCTSYHSNESISRSMSTKCSLSLSKDSHSTSSSIYQIGHERHDSLSANTFKNDLLTKRFEVFSSPRSKLDPMSELSFSKMYPSPKPFSNEPIDHPSNVYFSVVNMLSRPLEEYGIRGYEGSDTITSDGPLSDILSDEPQLLTNSDLDSSINFRRFITARKPSARAMLYSRRRSVIKALNTTGALSDDDKFPKELILLNQHSEPGLSTLRRHRLQRHPSAVSQSLISTGTFIGSSSSTNSIKILNPQNLKMDKIYINNALSQTTHTHGNSAVDPSLHDVYDVDISLSSVSLNALSTVKFNIRYPSRITHNYRNFLFVKPPLYMFYDSMKFTLGSNSSSSNSLMGSSGSHALGMLSFTNHNFSLIVCLLAFGIKYRILFSEYNNFSSLNANSKCTLSSRAEVRNVTSHSTKRTAIPIIGATGLSNSSIYDTTSLSEGTEKRTSSTSFLRSDPSQKSDYWNNDMLSQSLLYAEDMIFKTGNPASPAFRALEILSRVPIYHSRAMRKLFRFLNTDLERFDKVITSLSKDFLHQNIGNLNQSNLLDNRLDFNFLVSNSGLLTSQKISHEQWITLLKQVQMVVAKSSNGTTDLHPQPRSDHDFSQISSFAHILSAEHTLITSSESPSVSITTPLFDALIPEPAQPGQLLCNVLSASHLSESRQGNICLQNSQQIISSTLAPENLPIPGHKCTIKSMEIDENLFTLIHLVIRKTDSFDSSAIVSDTIPTKQYRRKRSRSYAEFTGNKLALLYNNLGKKIVNYVSMDDLIIKTNKQNRTMCTQSKFLDKKHSEIQEFKQFKEYLDGKFPKKTNPVPDSNSESCSSCNDYREFKTGTTLGATSAEETEIPLLTLPISSPKQSIKTNMTSDQPQDTNKLSISNPPSSRSTLSHFCYFISMSSDTESQSNDVTPVEKEKILLTSSLPITKKENSVTSLHSEDTSNNTSFTRENDHFDVASSSSQHVKFNTRSSTFHPDTTHSLITSAELSTQISSTLSTQFKSTPHNHSMMLDGTSTLPTAMDSYSCLYKLEINDDNEETDNSTHSVVLYNGIMPRQEETILDARPTILTNKRSVMGKNTMGGNPRFTQQQAMENTIDLLIDKTLTPLSSTFYSDSLQDPGGNNGNPSQGAGACNSQNAFYINKSLTEYSPNIWKTSSFISMSKPNENVERDPYTIAFSGRAVETSFCTSMQSNYENMVTSKQTPIPAYAPINLLKINQYRIVVYATFGTAFDLVARPSVSGIHTFTPIYSSHDTFPDNCKYGLLTDKPRSSNYEYIAEDTTSDNEKTITMPSSQESMIQVHERHNKFHNPTWRSTIYLKRCSLNAALSYIQLSDSSDYEINGEESVNTSDYQNLHAPALLTDTVSKDLIPDCTHNIFINPSMQKVYSGEAEDNHSVMRSFKLNFATLIPTLCSLFRHPTRIFQYSPRQKHVMQERVSFLATFIPGYIIRIVFDILFYIILYAVLFGAYAYTETGQRIYLLYICGRIVTFMNPYKWRDLMPSVDKIYYQQRSLESDSDAIRKMFLHDIVQITKQNDIDSNLTAQLAHNKLLMQSFCRALGILLLFRIKFTLIHIFSILHKEKSYFISKGTSFVYILKEHPTIYRIFLGMRSLFNIADLLSASILIFIRTFLVYEYLRIFKISSTYSLILFFLILIATYSNITIELSPMCNTRKGTICALYTHVFAQTIIFTDSRVYIEIISYLLRELKYLRLILGYYIFILVQKITNKTMIQRSAGLDDYILQRYLLAKNVSFCDVTCQEFLDSIVSTHKHSIRKHLIDSFKRHQLIKQKVPCLSSSLMGSLAFVFSRRNLEYSDHRELLASDTPDSLYKRLPNICNIYTSLYFICVVGSIFRVLFSQIILYRAMLNHVVKSMYIYIETKKLCLTIAYNKLDKIFFDCYLHTALTACNSLVYQIERFSKCISMDRDYKYIKKHLTLIGLASDLIYDEEIDLPNKEKAKPYDNLFKFGNFLVYKVRSFLRTRTKTDIDQLVQLGQDDIYSLSHSKTEELNAQDLHSSISGTSDAFLHSLQRTLPSVHLFTNPQEYYNIYSTSDFPSSGGLGTIANQTTHSSKTFRYIFENTHFTTWKKYCIFSTCYNSCNFVFRYLYDLETLKRVLLAEFCMKVCDENMYFLKPDTVFEPYYSKILAGILRALITNKDRRFNTALSPFLYIPPSYMLCIIVDNIYEAIADEGAHITLLKYISLLKIINDTVISDPNLLYIKQDYRFYIIYNSSKLLQSSTNTKAKLLENYAAIFYLCKIAYTIKKLFLWELEKRFFMQTFKVFGYISFHHELNICLVGQRLHRLSVLDVSAFNDRMRSISFSCGLFDVVLQEEICKIINDVYRTSTNTNGMLNIEVDEIGVYKKLLHINENI